MDCNLKNPFNDSIGIFSKMIFYNLNQLHWSNTWVHDDDGSYIKLTKLKSPVVF